jgi:hypothetical protein
MAAIALIQFTQGANTDAAGKAVLGDYGDFSAVTVTNDDNTDVISWVIYLLDAPPDSVTFPPASQPQILAQAIDNTPTVAFTPDVAGTYRVMLEVTDALSSIDRDIRCFAIPDERGFVRPPYQQNPEPLPMELPVLITRDPRPIKPDEQNYGANVRGWSGNGAASQLDAFFRQYGDLPFEVVAVTPFTASALDPPLHLVDSDTINAPATFNLPLSPRTGFVARVAVLGSPGNLVTIEAQGGGTVGDGSPLDLRGGKGVFLVHQGSNNWVILTGVPKDVSLLSTVMYVDFGSTSASPDGTILNPFPTILDAVNAGSDGVIYLTVGNYTAEVLNFVATPLELIALAGTPLYGFWLPTITTDSLLTLTNIGASVGDIVSTAIVYLNNCRIDGAISALVLVANGFQDGNNMCTLGGTVIVSSSIDINGYRASGSVSSTGGDVRLTDCLMVGSISGNSVYARDCVLQGAAMTIAGVTSKLIDCSFAIGTTITFSGSPGVLTVDGATYDSMLSNGVTVVNGTLDVLSGLEQQAANSLLANGTAGIAVPTPFAVGTNTVVGRVAGDLVAAPLVNAQVDAAAAIDLSKLAQQAANSFVANATGSSAVLTAVSVGTNTVVGRVGANIVAAPLVNAQVDAAAAIDLSKLAQQAANSIVANATGGSAVPTALAISADSFPARLAGNLVDTAFTGIDSTSIVYDVTAHEFQRAAITSHVSIPQNSNTATIQPNVLTPAMAAVLASSLGLVETLFVTAAAGAGGSADDITVYNGDAPFSFRILKTHPYITTAVATFSIQARTASGGGGTALSSEFSSTTATEDPAIITPITATTTVSASGSLFVRRTDSGIAFDMVFIIVKI